jgi:pimeloyl-ACP methyl ester carboxylesterase
MPSLIFLPGVGADPNFWRPVGERLPAAWRKTYLGWPGLGDQPADPAINRFEDLAGLVEAELGDEPADLIAQSMGGALAMMVALRHPDRVRRLVLTVTSGGLDMTGLGAADWRDDYRRLYPDSAAWVTDARPDLAGDLARVKQPALLIWGDADPISPVAVGERLRGRLVDAKLQIIAGGEHDLALTRSAEVAPLIEAHLA